MKRFFGAIKRFFLPAENAPGIVRVLPLVVVAFLVIALFAFSNFAWETTNSINFCGLSCHTMPPQYVTHQNSAHANVLCEDCHMGRGALLDMIPLKAAYSWQTGTAMITGRYEYPIVAKNMRPARDACENCHRPQTFTADTLVEIKHFAEDKTNTSTSTYLSVKTGGGTARQGLGRGIHWHIENLVYFYATDRERQNIPYVQVINADGRATEYTDLEAGFDPSMIKKEQLQKMDCITCHNRTAHGINDPQKTVDLLIARDLVSQTIPEIKQKGVEVIGASYPDVKSGLDAVAGLEKYYQSTYADFYTANQALIKKAVTSLQEAYQAANFPDQKFDWKTHPDNIGHQNTAGCFRCHDGKHLTQTGEAVRLECNLCHSIPVVAGPNKVNAVLQLDRGFEPETHKNSNWISLHRTVFDGSCKGCHTVEDAGGTSNSSFCSNSGCHGFKWAYAGFDAPKLRGVLAQQAASMATPTPLPTPLPAEPAEPVESTPEQAAPTVQAGATGGTATFSSVLAILDKRCSACHSSNGMKGLDLTSYASIMKGSQDGPVIIASDPAGSLLIKVQSAAEPHFGQFSAEELAMVKAWIQDGAKEK
jgi:nitrate/TMAO reductase-like tetraheme cytochrome c subunit